MARLAFAALALAMPVSVPALAQSAGCTAPASLPRPRHDGPGKDQPIRRLAIASYTLALSWSPQSCRNSDGRDRLRCGGQLGSFGFTLHGLWPDGAGKQWPQYCRPAAILPRAIISRNICATPSPDLIQHEWAKHGTCMGRDPAAYFGRSRGLYQAIAYPDMAALSRESDLTIGRFVDAFVSANPRIPADAVRVTTTRQGWLDEIWLCLDRRFAYQRCKANKDGGGAASQRLRIWRGN